MRLASTLDGHALEFDLDLVPESKRGAWSDYPVGVLRQMLELAELRGGTARLSGVELLFGDNLPVGAGLSSSAAIECAVAVALNELWRLGIPLTDLARIGQRAENDFVGAPTGIMDQTASLLGKRDSVVFLDCRSLESEIVTLGLADAGLELVVIDTGVTHAHETGGYAERRASCERAALLMGVDSLRDLTVDDLEAASHKLSENTFHRMRHVITENQRVLDVVAALRSDGPGAIGELLDASHRSMRDDFEISTPELDLAVEIAQANGALGARMTGGGFGGAAIALVPAGGVSRLQVAVDGGFAEHGFGMPETFTVAASDGAARDA